MLRRSLFLIVVLLALASSVFSQGVRRDDTVTVSIFGALKPVAGATVRVCSPGSTGNPCTPLASIYSDVALTQVLANPMIADAQANYHFYAAPGIYDIQTSGTGVATITLQNVPVPCIPGVAGCGGTGTFAGSLAVNQVAVGVAPNTIGGSSNFTYDSLSDKAFVLVGPTVSIASGISISSTGLSSVVGSNGGSVQLYDAAGSASAGGITANLKPPVNGTVGLGNNVNKLFIFDDSTGYTSWGGSTSGRAAIGCAAVCGTPATILVPTITGSAGQVLSTNGASPQQTSWINVATFTPSPPVTNLDCVSWSGTAGLLGDLGGKCARYTITPTPGDCVTWSGSGGLLGDAGAGCGGGGGGSGCTVTGFVTTWVLLINPTSTCYGSANFTWDDTIPTVGGGAGDNLFVGQNNVYTFTGTGTSIRRLADSRILGNGNALSGLSNNPKLTSISILGPLNTVSVDGTSTTGSQFTSIATATLVGDGNSAIATLQGQLGPVGIFGSGNTVSAPANCSIIDSVTLGVSNNTTCSSTGTTLTNVIVVGRNNTAGSTGGSAFSNVNIFGQGNNLTNCSNCYLFGSGMAPGSIGPGYVGVGLSSTPEIAITPGNVTVNGSIALKTIATATDCEANSVSPAACLAACAGSFVVPTTTTTYTVNTTCPTTNSSKYFLFPRTDATGLPSAPTCVTPAITSSWNRSAHANNVSFTLALPSTAGQTCWDFFIVSN